MTLEIHILAWDRHKKCGRVTLVNRIQHLFMISFNYCLSVIHGWQSTAFII